MNMSSILPNFRAIVAVCDDWGIGKAGDMLVHNREDKSYAPEGVEMARSIDEAVKLAGSDEVWVIGGGQIYKALLPRCAEAIVTKNHCLREADTFFPNLDEEPSWEVADIEDGGVTKSGIPFEFVTYRRA